MIVEDVHGSGRSHEPHEPAHVCRQRAQFPQVQPEERQKGGSVGVQLQQGVLRSAGHSPGRVGGGDEEIDDHSVTHVKALLH